MIPIVPDSVFSPQRLPVLNSRYAPENWHKFIFFDLKSVLNHKADSSSKRNALERLMKHLCGCFESQSFSWSVIQSVLNLSNFLISDCGHGSFLWNILAQQTVEIFIAAPLPAGKWSGKVGRALKLLINMRMRCKLFAVVKGQRLDPGSHWFELVHNG